MAILNLQQLQEKHATSTGKRIYTLDELKARQKKPIIPVQTTPTKPKKNILSKIGSFLISSEKKFGESIAGAIIPQTESFKEVKKSEDIVRDLQDRTIQKIKEKREKGEDTTELIDVLKSTGAITPDNEINPALDKTNKKIIGEALGVAIDIATAGTFGGIAKTAKTGKLLTKVPLIAEIFGKAGIKATSPTIIKPIAKTAIQAVKQGAIKGAVQEGAFGGAFGLSGALQDNEDLGGIIKRTITSAVTGAIFGGIVGGIANRKNLDPKILREQAIEKYKLGLRATKEKFKERADKVIPELLDEKVWGTRKKLLDKASKGIKLSLDEYKELGELKGMIETTGLLSGIDDEIAKFGKNVVDPETGEKIFRAFSINKQKVYTLQSLKSDLMALDAFDKVKDNQVYQQELRELAQFYGDDLYESRKALKTITDSKTLSQVRKVDSAIRELLNKKNPEYNAINEVYHRNSELFDILTETAKRESSGLGVKRIIQTLGTLIGVGGGLATGNIPLAIGSGIGMGSMLAILNSTWWNTLRAVQKNNLAEKLLEKGATQIPIWLLILEREGIKGVDQLLND